MHRSRHEAVKLLFGGRRSWCKQHERRNEFSTRELFQHIRGVICQLSRTQRQRYLHGMMPSYDVESY